MSSTWPLANLEHVFDDNAKGGPELASDGAWQGRAIVHLDMDAFFASVAQRDRPELRGRPVIVSGHSTQRGVASSASYEARARGVKSLMPLGQALSLCPEAVVLPVDMPRYRAVAADLFALCLKFSPRVEPVGFEEAYVDLSGGEALQGAPQGVARALQVAVRDRLGLSCSVGGGSSKLVARVASDLHKPGGFTWVPRGEEAAWLGPMPVGILPGVGRRTEAQLQARGVLWVQDLLAVPVEDLMEVLGSQAWLWRDMALGLDPRPVRPPALPKSMGAARTFDRDLETAGSIRSALHGLAGELAFRLRQAGLLARHLQLSVRGSSFTTVEVGQRLARAQDEDEALAEVALRLWAAHAPEGRRVRQLGLLATQFVTVHEASWLDPPELLARRRLHQAVDALRLRYGRPLLVRAAHLPAPKGS